MWPAWSWQFEQWLGCVHKDFAADITRIRANLSRPIALETLTAEEEIAIAFRDFGRFAS